MARCAPLKSITFDGLDEVMEIQILGWTVLADAEATHLAHERMAVGGPESCGCQYCRNFIAARELAYPPEAIELFSRLGIRADRETEIGAPVRIPESRWLYGGWFHFVGEIVDGPRLPAPVATLQAEGDIMGGVVRQLEFETLVDGFEIAFSTQAHLLPESFKGKRVVQLEFSTEIPWVIPDEEEPD